MHPSSRDAVFNLDRIGGPERESLARSRARRAEAAARRRGRRIGAAILTLGGLFAIAGIVEGIIAFSTN